MFELLRLRLTRTVVSGLTAALAVALTANSTLASPPDPMIGAQSHSTWASASVGDMRRELDLLQDAGANLVRADLNWSSLETEARGNYSSWYVERWDRFLDEAEARGLAVVATMFGTPCWASTAPEHRKQGCTGSWWERGVTAYPPDDVDDFGAAVGWVSERWGSRIEAIEVWNEPNEFDGRFLKAANPEATYTALLRSAYMRAKAVSDVTVLAGALSFSDAEFLRGMYSHGAKGYFDAVAIHPYNEWRNPYDPWRLEYRKYTYLTGVPHMHDVMTTRGDGAKKVWLTELGWSHCTDGDPWCVSRPQQARFVGNAIRIMRDWDFVAGASIYQLRDSATEIDRENRFGLVRRDFTPKRSYRVFKRALAGNYPRSARLDPRLRSRRSVTIRVRRTVGLSAVCRGDGVGRCRGTVKLKANGVVLGTQGVAVPLRRTMPIRVKLNRRGLRLTRARRQLPVRARASWQKPAIKRHAVRRFRLVAR